MPNIQDRLSALEQRIARACEAAGRSRQSVNLIAVSKTQSASTVRTAACLGLQAFGENYLDEALSKINNSTDLPINWHYIGRIQSNKTADIAQNFDWIHTIDRKKIAQRLNNQCPQDKQLNVLIQVNIDADPAKGGVLPEQVSELLDLLIQLPNLRPRGLMTILAQNRNPVESYLSVAKLFNTLGKQIESNACATWDVLSMGMTGDLESAIAAGATHIRIGTALFGERKSRPSLN